MSNPNSSEQRSGLHRKRHGDNFQIESNFNERYKSTQRKSSVHQNSAKSSDYWNPKEHRRRHFRNCPGILSSVRSAKDEDSGIETEERSHQIRLQTAEEMLNSRRIRNF
ncbi:hypothetical protein AVEN_221675-1 [Araneus ventricosus]|uniref:Uncharacterized protein n=1 Tax=Araneus ventricosus TaxID=182803 RepID=A0A4Y2QEF2_ARAVE|nr:hypothetical protein AVEN_221675-1 [Araneus ventricosus]